MKKYELIHKSDEILAYFKNEKNTQNMTEEQKEKVVELFDTMRQLYLLSK